MIIDSDGHFTPELIDNKSFCRQWLRDYNKRKQGHFSLADSRCQELDNLGIDWQVQNPMGKSLHLTYDLPAALAVEIMQIYNDTMVSIADKFPRLIPNLWLSMQQPMACMNEIYRNLDASFFAVYVSDLPAWGYADIQQDFWRLLEREKIPFYMHLGHTSDDSIPLRMNWQGRYNQLVSRCYNDNRWMLSVASMIDSGLLDTFTDLRIVLAERDINWFDQLSAMIDKDIMPYLKKNFWFTAEPEMPWFRSCAQILGYDRILFATDWPHEHDVGGANRNHDVWTVKNLDLSAQQQTYVFSDNFLYLTR